MTKRERMLLDTIAMLSRGIDNLYDSGDDGENSYAYEISELEKCFNDPETLKEEDSK